LHSSNSALPGDFGKIVRHSSLRALGPMSKPKSSPQIEPRQIATRQDESKAHLSYERILRR
jgi:hypothetical protein